ncbi:nuclear transport factor 2 family protein [Colwellia sp. 1_MG-2023]|uniref:nuclear transport factor 2 family protein n=1 Tax=Colwellia sp. 1_MG-2023 TaxID=3062649 RepID=UPI0026E2A366|nr:nuclear transport factor 2 family protein [Colwellia sp. 1_MG-2023]MDO6444896.1 nuclear transport factor 2 family protein [Colwellia sp. 1_MG-2023]
MLRVLLCFGIFIVATSAFAQPNIEKTIVNQTLERFHQAAAEANYVRYFDLFAEQAVFLGTDGNERWTKEAFKQFVMPHFSKGNGWLYTKIQRNISLVKDKDIAFFDELLFNKNYGQCRGTGILIKENNTWKILQYNLSIPVPNEISEQIVGLIQKVS